jgi:hypothetical protein
MDDEDPPAPARTKPSQVPSWISLGFALGALFVMALPRHAEAPPPAPEPAPAPPAPAPMTTVEAVFETWGKYAVWDDDRTQVALWDVQSKAYSDCYEVLRVGDKYYFRSIPSLTRPVLTHGVVPESPMEFTESEPQRAAWLNDVRQENWKSFTGAAHDSLAPAPVAKPQDPK